jgi:hypothetical protein
MFVPSGPATDGNAANTGPRIRFPYDPRRDMSSSRSQRYGLEAAANMAMRTARAIIVKRAQALSYGG